MANFKQTILDREWFTQALRRIGEQDLLYLNRMLVVSKITQCAWGW